MMYRTYFWSDDYYWLYSYNTAPPVTLLRPICGLENNLEETLESSFNLEYLENFEIIFCAAYSTDPAIPIVEKLIVKYPDVDARLLIGNKEISPHNPKLNNLYKGWYAAKFDYIVIADSNLLLPTDYLNDLMACWVKDDTTGLVSSPPYGSRPESLGAELECAYLNTYAARWQFAAAAFGWGFAQGKTMLMRRSMIKFEDMAQYPAEDAGATKIIRDMGKKLVLVAAPYEQPLGTRNFSEVLNRQLRWARLRRYTFPLLYASEIFSGAFVPRLIGLGIGLTLGSYNWLLVEVFFSCWYGAEFLLARFYGWPVSWRTPFFLILRDYIIPFIWIRGWLGNDFSWRGNQIELTTPTITQRIKMYAQKWRN